MHIHGTAIIQQVSLIRLLYETVLHFRNLMCDGNVGKREPSVTGTLPCQRSIKLLVQRFHPC